MKQMQAAIPDVFPLQTGAARDPRRDEATASASARRDAARKALPPMLKVWEGVLAVPLVGTLDSDLINHAMTALSNSADDITIFDVTGVSGVNPQAAQEWVSAKGAIRNAGSRCIVSGVRPQVLQALQHLGMPLDGITTRETLAEAVALAVQRAGFIVTRGWSPAACDLLKP